MNIDFGISESIKKIDAIIQKEYPKELSNLAEDIFASGGKSHNRNWSENKPSTIKRKGGNSPNIETGQLENWLTTDNNLVDDDYMARLPTPSKGTWGENGYLYANELRKFDDIGRTPEDEEYIVNQLVIKIRNNLQG